MSTFRITPLLIAWLASQSSMRAAPPAPTPLAAELIAVRRIWNGAPHNAFTDLVRWHDQWICAFREGASHVGNRGALRVLASSDAVTWISLAKIEDDVLDLRDANLSIAPDGRLMIVGGAQTLGDTARSTRSFVTFSADGKTWTPREFVTEPGRWMWGAAWHDGVAWGVAYGAPARAGASSLLTSRDGQKFDVAVDEFFAKAPRPTEARLRFAGDGTAYCLHRCDGPASRTSDDGVTANMAWLGRAAAPYRDWTWRPLDRFIGGPNLIELPSGQWLAAGRILQPKPVTALMHLDVEQGRATPILTLPSGGDTSYPGLVWHDGRLWVSYYSSHEQGTNIYLAEVRIDEASR
jgi:hypothetical protein